MNYGLGGTMKTVAAGCASVLLLLSSGLASAAPTQLYGKAISISYSVTANAVAEDGTTSSRPRSVQRTIYISSKGRVFSRSERQAGRNSDTVERGPDATGGHFSFQGNRLIGVNTNFISGAGQLVVSFDSSFQSCTASITLGRESGKAFKFKGLNGKTFTATGTPTVSTPSCSIREGNPF
jgi:hypothetical protein